MVKAHRGDDKWLERNNLLLVDGAHQRSARLMAYARELVVALPDRMKDDRYLSSDLSSSPRSAAIVSDAIASAPLAFVGGSTNGQLLQLDALASRSGSTSADDVATALRLLVNHLESLPGDSVYDNGTDTEVWTRPDEGDVATAVAAMGFHRTRSLHQLRMALPGSNPPIATRAFDPVRDLSEVVRVNNEAFASHPDQGNQTEQTIGDVLKEQWFEPAGLRVLDDPEGSGSMAGFCWTKIHPSGNYLPATYPASGSPAVAIGEIYVIGLDPKHHGMGLGVPLVAAGLSWLAEQGLGEVLLYVESDNKPALRTYERLGFTVNRTDTAWRRTA